MEECCPEQGSMTLNPLHRQGSTALPATLCPQCSQCTRFGRDEHEHNDTIQGGASTAAVICRECLKRSSKQIPECKLTQTQRLSYRCTHRKNILQNKNSQPRRTFDCRSTSLRETKMAVLLAFTLVLLSVFSPVTHAQPSTSSKSNTIRVPEGTQSLSNMAKFPHIQAWRTTELEDPRKTANDPLFSKPHTVLDAVAAVGRLFQYHIPEDHFSNTVSDYKATQAGLPSLPKWLSMNYSTGEFLGVPLSNDKGRIYISIEAQVYSEIAKDRIADHTVMENGIFTIEVCELETRVRGRDDSNFRSSSSSSQDTKKVFTSELASGFDSKCDLSFPPSVNCTQGELPVLANMLFIVDFPSLSARQRAFLFLKASALADVCPSKFFWRDLAWSEPEGAAIWSKLIFNPYKLAGLVKTATILSFQIGCSSQFNLSEGLDQQATVAFLNDSLHAKSQAGISLGLPGDGNGISYEQWFLSIGPSVIMQAAKVETNSDSHYLLKRQVDDNSRASISSSGNVSVVATAPSSAPSSSQAQQLSLLSSLAVPPTRVIPTLEASIPKQSPISVPSTMNQGADIVPSSTPVTSLSGFRDVNIATSFPVIYIPTTISTSALPSRSAVLSSPMSLPVSFEILTMSLDMRLTSSFLPSSPSIIFSIPSSIEEPTTRLSVATSIIPTPTVASTGALSSVATSIIPTSTVASTGSLSVVTSIIPTSTVASTGVATSIIPTSTVASTGSLLVATSIIPTLTVASTGSLSVVTSIIPTSTVASTGVATSIIPTSTVASTGALSVVTSIIPTSTVASPGVSLMTTFLSPSPMVTVTTPMATATETFTQSSPILTFFSSMPVMTQTASVSLLMPMSPSEILTMSVSTFTTTPTPTLTSPISVMSSDVLSTMSLETSFFFQPSSSFVVLPETSFIFTPTPSFQSTSSLSSSVPFSSSLPIPTPFVSSFSPPITSQPSSSVVTISRSTVEISSPSTFTSLEPTFSPTETTVFILSTSDFEPPTTTSFLMPFSTAESPVPTTTILSSPVVTSSSLLSSPLTSLTPTPSSPFSSDTVIFRETSMDTFFPTETSLPPGFTTSLSTPGLTTSFLTPAMSTATMSTVLTTISDSRTASSATSIFITPTPTPPISICNMVDCVNGECIDDFMMFECQCYAGWTGQFCENDIDDCTDAACLKLTSVRCIDGNGTYTCDCLPGFSGQNCETDLTPCDPDPCLGNETCLDMGLGEFVCRFIPPTTSLDASSPAPPSTISVIVTPSPVVTSSSSSPSTTPSPSVPVMTTIMNTSISVVPSFPSTVQPPTTSTIMNTSISVVPSFPSTVQPPTTSTIMNTSTSVDTSFPSTVQPPTTSTIMNTSTSVDTSFPSTVQPPTTSTIMNISTSVVTSFLPTVQPPTTSRTPSPTPSPTLTTTLMSTISLSLSPSISPSVSPSPSPNNPPILLNPVGTVIANEGQIFQYAVPEETFYDPENGLTSNLTLSLTDLIGVPIPNSSWIQISGRMLEGVPLQTQIQSSAITEYVFILRAEDSVRNAAHSFVTVRIFPASNILNFLAVFFEGNFQIFDQNLSSKIDLISHLAQFSGTQATNEIYVGNFRNGSIGISYHNLSIADLNCADFQEWVRSIYTIEKYTNQFIQSVRPYSPTSEPEIEGPCNTTSINMPPTLSTNEDVDSQFLSDQLILTAVLVPASIVGLVLLVTGIGAFVLYRRHRKERDQLEYSNMGRAFLNRRPVIIERDLDLPPRRRAPVILANDFAEDDVDDPGIHSDSSSEEEMTEYPLIVANTGSLILSDPPHYRYPPEYPT